MVEAFFKILCLDRVKMNKIIKLKNKISFYRRISNYNQKTAKRNHHQINPRAYRGINIRINQAQLLRIKLAFLIEKFRKYLKN